MNREPFNLKPGRRSWFGQMLCSDEGIKTINAHLRAVSPDFLDAFSESLRSDRFNELEHAAMYLALPRLIEAGFRQLSLTPLGLSATSSEGKDALFLPIAHGWSAAGLGQSADVKRLLAGLHEAIGGISRYQVHIKRPLPVGVDVPSICRAVQLWALAGVAEEGPGGCAAYIDGDVALEVCLHGEKGSEGLTSLVGPLDAQDRLVAVEQLLNERASHLREVDAGRAVIALIASDAPLVFPRWAIQHVFYGCPTEASHDPEGYRVRYPAPVDGAFFSGEPSQPWSSLWWLEPEDSLNKSWCLRDPWAHDASPALPMGRIFGCRSRDESGVCMGWSEG